MAKLTRRMSGRLQAFSYFMTFSFLAAFGCALYYGLYDDAEAVAVFNFKKPVDHLVALDEPNGLIQPFRYVVFTDPQLGLRDAVEGNDGTDWRKDLEAIEMFGELTSNLDPEFIVCDGDLNNAYPVIHDPADDPSFKPVYRPPQTYDLLTAFEKSLSNNIPTFMLAGNHDLEEPNPEIIDAYEKIWGESYFSFWNRGHFFIAVETQFYRSEDPRTLPLLEAHNKWLERTLSSNENSKTVFQHVPLFIDNSEETDSEFFEKSVPLEHRKYLLDLYCENNVKVVISGHTHFTHFPAEYECANGNKIKQVIITSISTSLRRSMVV